MKKLTTLLLATALLVGCANNTSTQTNTSEVNTNSSTTASTNTTRVNTNATANVNTASTNVNTSAAVNTNTSDAVNTNAAETTESDDAALTITNVAKHKTSGDCWMIISENVYDVSDFESQHPGGSRILEGCGKDATGLFNGTDPVGRMHSSLAKSMLNTYKLGALEK